MILNQGIFLKESDVLECRGSGEGLLRKSKGSRQGKERGGGVRGIEVRSTWKWKRGHDQGWGGALGHCQLKVSQLKLFIQPCVLGPDLMASHL